jgi:hypothetical protein
MPRKKTVKKTEFDITLMSEAQCEEVRQSINNLEKMLNDERPWVRGKITDEKEVRAEIRKKRALLNEHSPKKLRGAKANRAYAEAKKLKEFIAEHMPDRKSYFQRYSKDTDSHNKQADFERAVQQQMEFQKNPDIQRAVTRYKNIMRRIDSDDPMVSNIEALRK